MSEEKVYPVPETLAATAHVNADRYESMYRQSIEAPINGRIVRWWVAEGTEVKAGDPLFEITDNDPQLIDRMRERVARKSNAMRVVEGAPRRFCQGGACG